MVCQICNKRPANVHITRSINGAKTELHVCDQCAEKEGFSLNSSSAGFDAPFSFSNILAGYMDFPGFGGLPYQVKRNDSCSACGMDYEDFKKTGRFGCSECYKSFSGQVEPLIKRIHGNSQHTGKVPRRTGGIIRIKRDIESLKAQLSAAIQNEQYEKAAELRDKIKALENRNNKE